MGSINPHVRSLATGSSKLKQPKQKPLKVKYKPDMIRCGMCGCGMADLHVYCNTVHASGWRVKAK